MISVATGGRTAGFLCRRLYRSDESSFSPIRDSLRNPHALLFRTTHAAAATLRTANENITRVTPLIIMLTPISVPIAHTELEGHCR
jgi:hypothetical protein